MPLDPNLMEDFPFCIYVLLGRLNPLGELLSPLLYSLLRVTSSSELLSLPLLGVARDADVLLLTRPPEVAVLPAAPYLFFRYCDQLWGGASSGVFSRVCLARYLFRMALSVSSSGLSSAAMRSCELLLLEILFLRAANESSGLTSRARFPEVMLDRLRDSRRRLYGEVVRSSVS